MSKDDPRDKFIQEWSEKQREAALSEIRKAVAFRLSKEQLEAIKEQLKMVNERRGIAERKLKKGLWTVDEMIYQTDENIREALQAIVHIVSGEGKDK